MLQWATGYVIITFVLHRDNLVNLYKPGIDLEIEKDKHDLDGEKFCVPVRAFLSSHAFRGIRAHKEFLNKRQGDFGAHKMGVALMV
jgi:hypothetical protein